MKRTLAILIPLLLIPAAAFAEIEYDHTLPDTLGWGICFTLLLLIMGYRFGEGPAMLAGAIVLGYWGFQTYEVLSNEALLVPKEVQHTHRIATLIMTLFAFFAFLTLCKRKRNN